VKNVSLTLRRVTGRVVVGLGAYFDDLFLTNIKALRRRPPAAGESRRATRRP
jgi:hypothetical protein